MKDEHRDESVIGRNLERDPADDIPLRVAQRQTTPSHRDHYDAPYRLFIAASLLLAIFGGFLLAILISVARALEVDTNKAWPALVQAHGQLQLLGFAGLFVMGMALRLMPRFAGRPLVLTPLIRPLPAIITSGLVVRAIAQPWATGVTRDAALLASAALLVAGAIAFAAIVLGTLLHTASRAEATGWYFCFGALAYVMQAALNAAIVVEMLRRDDVVAPHAKDDLLVFIQLFGFIMLFLCGVATRAVPALTGTARSAITSRIVASVLAAGVSMYAFAAFLAATRSPSVTLARTEDVALLMIAGAFVIVAWLVGVFRPRANRVGQAAQVQFNFVRAAFVWLLVGAALMIWYATPALRDGVVLDNFETDVVRHVLTVGVVTMMIVGMAMLVLPELAGRRLQHPREGIIVLTLLLALNAGAALRAWPALRGLSWITADRYWPMFAAGILATAVLISFAFIVWRSYSEQRAERWASREALAALRRGTER